MKRENFKSKLTLIATGIGLILGVVAYADPNPPYSNNGNTGQDVNNQFCEPCTANAIRSDHPDWSADQVSDEVNRRKQEFDSRQAN